MKKLLALFFVLSFLGATTMNAQTEECGFDATADHSASSNLLLQVDTCFDVAYVQENCIPVYINVNVHFFLDDNCSGQVAVEQQDVSPETNLYRSNAFALAEGMINDANDFMEAMGDNSQWNSLANGLPESTPQCVPIRYVLSGVHFHCDTEGQLDGPNDSFNVSDYLINEGTEMNILITELDWYSGSSTSPDGYASDRYNYAVIESFAQSTFNHEMAHAFGLDHTFESQEGCDDTWNDSWVWDSDCNGTNDVNGYSCWNNAPTYNGEDACNNAIFCNPHPCCNWSNNTNNLMSYSSYGDNPNSAALTPCQVETMLTDIATNMCDYVADVGNSCPPVNAFIGTLPTVDGETDCPTCFHLNASFNEEFYEMEIVDASGNTVVETGTVAGQAGKYCIPSGVDKWGNLSWGAGFQTGQRYTLRLEVANRCGDKDRAEITFVLPEPCGGVADPGPDNPIIDIRNISPNPTTRNTVNVEYSVKEAGELNVYGMHSNTGTTYGLLKTIRFNAAEEDVITTISVQTWQRGGNTLVFQYGDELHTRQVIKQ